MEEVTITQFLDASTYGNSNTFDKDPSDLVAAFESPGVWKEYRGVRYSIDFVLVSGPSKEAVVKFLQDKRDAYGHRDTMHCKISEYAKWYTNGGCWHLCFCLLLTTGDHLLLSEEDVAQGKRKELSEVLLAIPESVLPVWSVVLPLALARLHLENK